MRTLYPWKFGFIALAMIAASRGATRPPNILFICTDDQSYRTISCYEGAEYWVRTPNIDRLAQRGVRFTDAYTGTWCMPSRTTMLTGLHQHGVQTLRMEGTYPGCEYDPKQCPFWPAVFRKHGYSTAQIGKWHVGTDSGFGRDWDFQKVWNRPKYPDNAGNYYYDQMISTNGAAAIVTAGYSTDNYTKWAVDYIKGEQRDPQKPWYLWLCYAGVHSPFTPADRHRSQYREAWAKTPQDIYPPRPSKPEYVQNSGVWEPGPNGEPVLKRDGIGKQVGDDAETSRGRSLTSWVQQYNQAVTSVDEGVGKLVAALEESGQLENTVVVFTSDQGFAWGQHGFRHKLAPYDANIRGPLIFSMPGTLPEGKVCRVPVSGVDIVPSLFQFAGLELPWAMHGHDLTPLLKDPSSVWEHTTMVEFTGDKFGANCDVVPAAPKSRFERVPWYLMIRQGRYKYIRTLEAGETEELYDLAADPDELENLATYPRFAARLTEMRTATALELRRTGAKMADSLPVVRASLH